MLQVTCFITAAHSHLATLSASLFNQAIKVWRKRGLERRSPGERFWSAKRDSKLAVLRATLLRDYREHIDDPKPQPPREQAS
jgi:hypothetical protein